MDSKLKRDARVRKAWKISNIILVCITIILAIFFMIQLNLATNSEKIRYSNEYDSSEGTYEMPDIYDFLKWMPYILIIIIFVVLSLIDLALIIQKIKNKNYKNIFDLIVSIFAMFVLSSVRRMYFTFVGYIEISDQIRNDYPMAILMMIVCLLMINVFFALSFPKKEETENKEYVEEKIKKEE